MSDHSDNYGSEGNAFNMLRILSRQRKGLNIVHINAQSLHCKMDEFRYIFASSGVDIICISETWFHLDINDTLYSLQGFRLYRSDRLTITEGRETRTRGGGVAIYVRQGISCAVKLKSTAGDDIEFLLLEVIAKRNRKILVGCVYKPHRDISVESIVNVLEDISVLYTDVIILGDFNNNLLVSNPLIHPMSSLGLKPVNIAIPTHYHGQSNSLIDLIFVSDESKVLLYDQIMASAFSNHDLLFLTYDTCVPDQPAQYTYRDIHNMDRTVLYQNFLNIDWHRIYWLNDVNDQLGFLHDNVNKLFEECVPMKIRRIKSAQEPWFTSDIKDLIKVRDAAYCRWKRFRTDELRKIFQSCRRDVVRGVKLAKRLYYEEKFSTAIDTKSKWMEIRKIGIGRLKTPTTGTNVDINALNQSFLNMAIPPPTHNIYEQLCSVPIEEKFSFQCVSPCEVLESFSTVKSKATGMDGLNPLFLAALLPDILPFVTHLCNTILTKSTFPDGWKHSKIIPIPKQNNEYRPIAILPFLSKVMEKIMSKQINAYLTRHNLLSDVQSGFVKGRSCITALTDVVENLRGSLDNSMVSFLILLDHSKAFDTVDHSILTRKLEKLFYFSGTASKLVQSYLSGRSQTVFYNNKYSDAINVNRGVPQGSILGPLLFCLYINDLPGVIDHCGIQMYADDVQIFSSCKFNDIYRCVNNINLDLMRVKEWASSNGLCINPEKSKCIFLNRNNKILNNNVEIRIDKDTIKFVSSCKNLGIIFNDKLSWSNHISTVVGRVYGMLRNLWAVKHSTPFKIRLLLAKVYLIPVLLYGCEIFGSCSDSDFNKLRVAYNNIARYIYDRRRRDSISYFSYQIYQLTFENLLKWRSLIFLHRVMTAQQPNYLFRFLKFGRTVRGRKLIQQKYKTTFSQRQFFIYCISLWNHLPNYIQNINNVRRFKIALFEYLSLKF